MLQVTDEQVGTWFHSSFSTPIEFDIKIVEFAMDNGYDIKKDVWEADKPIFLGGQATEEMLDDLRVLADYSVGFLNEEVLPENFYFVFDDAGDLVLQKDLTD